MRVKGRTRIQKKISSRSIYNVFITIFKIILFSICLFLAYEGCKFSYYSSSNYQEPIFEQEDSVWIHLSIFLLVCIIVGITLFLLNSLKERFLSKYFIMEKGVLITACAWLMILGLMYIVEHPYYPTGDQINTTAGAAYARAGNYVMFSRGGYIGLYEQQKGLLFLYEILFSIFGDFCYGVAACFHVIFSVITLVAGYSLLKILADNSLYCILYCIMMMSCMPYMIYLPYIYGDLPSICFAMVLFWAMAAYGKRLQRRYVVIGGAMAALALLVRMNSWIVLIAVGIGMVLLALEKKTFRPLLACMCIILAAWGTVKAVEKMYEYRSGYESGVGLPSILWMAMGLQETDGRPGVYNRYQQNVFEECGFEREPAIQVGREYIAMRLDEFKENPEYAYDFFLKKVKMQWLEPLFEGLYETNSFPEMEEIPEGAFSLYYGNLHDAIWKASNYYQSIVYLAMLSFVVGSILHKGGYLANSAGWIPLIAVVGGFLFCIVWESKSRYILPYYMYMLPFASMGIGKTAEGICGFCNRFFGKGIGKSV